jgi:hypothetical protein
MSGCQACHDHKPGSKGLQPGCAGLEALIYEKRAEEREAEASSGQQPAKRAKQDLIKSRPNWVKGSVSEAVRRPDGGQHRSPYGNLKWRGSGQ